MPNKLGRWLAKRSDSAIAAGQAASVAFLAWFGATLGIWLTSQTAWRYAVLSGIGIVVVALVSFFARYATLLRQRYRETRAGAIEYVHSQLDRLVSEEQRVIEEMRDPGLVEIKAAPRPAIDSLVRELFNLLNSRFQDNSLPGEAVYFESVYMTKSYVDGQITICSWANSADRQPTSLSMRAGNPTIYDRTVTADLFREAETKRPEPRLIHDTDTDPNYSHLYATQHERIKSTIVYPVMSSTARLLGALVITADRADLFRQQDKGYWCSMLRLYERRLALEALRLDTAVCTHRCPAPF